jgi:hypothetical protein
VNGSGFVSASVVNWNGNGLATGFISASQLTATVPVIDLSSAGTAQVTVTSPAPGGGTSSAQTFTINAAVPGASLSGSALSFGSIPQGIPSTGQSVTLTNSGTVSLSITSITTTGNFSETNTCGSNLPMGSNCQITVTFTPAFATALIGSLTINDNAPGSPQTVSLSGAGVAPVSIGTTNGGSTSAKVSSGGTAIYNLSLTGAAGFSGNVSLNCSGAPQNASCSINPTSINLSAGNSASFTVSVTTTGSESAVLTRRSSLRLAGVGISSLLLLPLFLRIRRRVRHGGLFLAVICLFLAISGCGGGNNQTTTSGQTVTPAGTYTLTIAAATSNASVQQNLTLIVQ